MTLLVKGCKNPKKITFGATFIEKKISYYDWLSINSSCCRRKWMLFFFLLIPHLCTRPHRNNSWWVIKNGDSLVKLLNLGLLRHCRHVINHRFCLFRKRKSWFSPRSSNFSSIDGEIKLRDYTNSYSSNISKMITKVASNLWNFLAIFRIIYQKFKKN